MNARICRGASLALLLLVQLLLPAHAQTTAGAGTVLVIPVVAATASYTTEVVVRNPNGNAMTITVRFYEARTSSVPGQRPCADLPVNSLQSVTFTLAVQCTLGAGSHHGMLILEDAAAHKTNLFYAYSRAQTPGGNGFSVEAFPIGNFSGANSGVPGLKRQAAPPHYQTNCFVAALGEAVDYSITLTEPTASAAIGNAVTGSLQPYEMDRILDIFTAAGLPPGDYSNIRAAFTHTNAGQPAYVAFCTLQESTFFGADFRIARSQDALDRRQKRFLCYAQNPCGTEIVGTGQTAIPDAATKYIHTFFVDPPDYIECDLVSARIADLEMQVRGPGDVFASTLFVSGSGGVGSFDSGGNNKTSFYIFTGFRNAFSAFNGNNGQTDRLFIDVSFREGGNPTFPIPYGITCTSGNGVSIPYFRASTTDDF